ncbi:MAG: thiol:disulfide interchange protein DsbA/DsbL [Burkholderiaceae bacterium]
MLNRRDLSRRLASLAGAFGAGRLMLAARPAAAQQALVEGEDYVRIDKPVDVPHDGKIDVIEFFWYGCPHCYAFEPFIEPWIARLPPDVRFQRVAYGFDEVLRERHQRVFYTLEALGLVDALHSKVFDRFHRQRKPIDDEAGMLQFARDNGLDAVKVKDAWSSFAVATKMRRAKALCEAYGVDFVPLVAIQGRFLTTPRTDRDGPRALAAADSLISQARKEG